jgi:hypothetical protein
MARTLTLVLCSSLLGLVACDSRSPDGGKCESNENCKDGLICQASMCANALKAMGLRTKNMQRSGQKFMHDNSGSCPTVADLAKEPDRNDAWGNPFIIQCPSEHAAIDVLSNGPDGKPETADDIHSWD